MGGGGPASTAERHWGVGERGGHSDAPIKPSKEGKEIKDSKEDESLSPEYVALDRRITAIQKDLNSALRKMSTKESEKFDLIFAILSELQTRQAKMEDAVSQLKDQLLASSNCGAPAAGSGMMGSEAQAFPAARRMGPMACIMTPNCVTPSGSSCTPMGMQVQFVQQVVAIPASPNGMTGPTVQGMQPMPAMQCVQGVQYAMVSPANGAKHDGQGTITMQFVQAPPCSPNGMPCSGAMVACPVGGMGGMAMAEGDCCYAACAKEGYEQTMEMPLAQG